MSIEYRAMYPEEEDVALDLWAEVLGDDRAALKRTFVYNDRHRFEHHYGVRPGDEAAILALLYAAGTYAAERGIVRGQVDLPDEPLINAALERLFGPSLHLSSEPNGMMARTIAPDFEQRALDEIFAAPGSICWGIDEV